MTGHTRPLGRRMRASTVIVQEIPHALKPIPELDPGLWGRRTANQPPGHLGHKGVGTQAFSWEGSCTWCTRASALPPPHLGRNGAGWSWEYAFNPHINFFCTALTKKHKTGDLKQQIYSLTVLEAISLRSRGGQGSLLQGDSEGGCLRLPTWLLVAASRRPVSWLRLRHPHVCLRIQMTSFPVCMCGLSI